MKMRLLQGMVVHRYIGIFLNKQITFIFRLADLSHIPSRTKYIPIKFQKSDYFPVKRLKIKIIVES